MARGKRYKKTVENIYWAYVAPQRCVDNFINPTLYGSVDIYIHYQ